MSLEPALVPVLFDKALDQKNNYKVQLPGTFLTIDNAVRRKGSLWEKRYGTSPLPDPPYLTGRSLASFNDTLCYCDGNTVQRYSPTMNSWSAATGFACPISFKNTPVVRNQSQSEKPDTAYNGGFVATVCSTDGASAITVQDTSGAVIVPSMPFPNGELNARIVACADAFLVFGMTVFNGLVVYRVPVSSIGVTAMATLLGTVTSTIDATVASAINIDVCSYDANAVVVAYQNPSNGETVAIIRKQGDVGNGSNGYPAPVTVGNGATPTSTGCVGVFSYQQYVFAFRSRSMNTSGPDGSLYCTVYAPALTSPTTVTIASHTGGSNTTYIRNVTAFAVQQTGQFSVACMYEEYVYPNSYTYDISYNTITVPVVGSIVAHTSTSFYGRGVGLVGKAFLDASGNAYISISYNDAFDASVQNAYFLVQLPNYFPSSGPVGDAHVVSRFCYERAVGDSAGNWVASPATDGSGNYFVPYNSFIESQAINTGTTNTSYPAWGIDLYTIRFDARFSPTSQGKTTQLCGGLVSHYDGQSVAELGFFNFPSMQTSSVYATGTSGSLAAGTYYYRIVFEYIDSAGLVHRSIPSVINSVAVGATQEINVLVDYPITNRPRTWARTSLTAVVYLSIAGDANLFYRTLVMTNGSPSSAFSGTILTMSQSSPLLYTTGGIADSVAPPAANVSHVHKNRIWLGGLETSELWFSEEFVDGFAPTFSDMFTVPIEAEGGDVTALASLDEKLVIFKDSQFYALVGDGPDEAGLNWDYSEPVKIPSDVGCIDKRAVIEIPEGVLFKSKKGWYLLTRALQTLYVGAAVEDYNSLTASSVTLVKDETEVRIVHSNGVCLVYNYYFKQWSTFSNYEGLDSAVVTGTYFRIGTDYRVYKEVVGQYNDSGTKYSLTVETSWLSLAKLQGYQRVYALQLLADFVDDHQLEVQIAYDFQNAYNQTVNFTTTGVISGTVLQLRIQPAIQKCTAIKLRIVDNDTVSPSGGASLKPTSLAVEVGRKRGAARLPPAQSL